MEKVKIEKFQKKEINSTFLVDGLNIDFEVSIMSTKGVNHANS